MPRGNHFDNARTLSILLDRTLLGLCAITTAIPFARLLYYSGYGLQLSDEGLYLNSMANPFAYSINIPASLFGFVYRWPYHWAGDDIAVLRMANVTLTMALGWILSFLVIRRLWTIGWPHAAVLSSGIASLGLVAFYTWMTLTPNYYTLNIQSVSMVMIGLLLADQSERIRQVLGGGLIGVGGWLCFMARPTTAAAIAVVVILYVIVLRRKLLLPMLGAALVAHALLTVTAYLIGGGITGLASRMVNSAEMEILLGAGHEVSLMFRIDGLATSRSQLAIDVLVAAALLLGIFMGSTHKLLSLLAVAAVLLVTIANALLGTDAMSTALLGTGMISVARMGIDLTSIDLSTLFLVPALTCLGAMFYRQGMVLRTQTPTSVALVLIFLVLPHVSALGSAANYWTVGSLAALFWMLAAVAFLSPLAQQGRNVAALLPLTVLAQLLTVSVVNAGIIKPLAQMKDLNTYTAVMSLPGGGKLVLSQSFYDYLATARAQARAAGLEVGTPVVDLSGHSPSLLYVLEARALGLPWLIGGYPGSNAIAVETLRLENCADLAKAWVLIAPEGPRHLDPAIVLASIGAGQADYVTTATFETPAIDFPRAHKQFFYKPIRPAAVAEQSCREARRQRSDSRKWSKW